MSVLLLTQSFNLMEVASKPTRNGSFIPKGTQMPTEGTGQKSLLLWRKPMAQVTYRGVKYDTEEYTKVVLNEAAQRRNHDLMYRGVKVSKKLVTA